MTHPVMQARTHLDHSGQVLCVHTSKDILGHVRTSVDTPGHTSKDMFGQDRISVDVPGHISENMLGQVRTSVTCSYKQGHVRTSQDKCHMFIQARTC